MKTTTKVVKAEIRRKIKADPKLAHVVKVVKARLKHQRKLKQKLEKAHKVVRRLEDRLDGLMKVTQPLAHDALVKLGIIR